MKKNNNHNLFYLATASILSALSILLGKYLAINIGDTIRISFENFPILLAGFYFGPWFAASVGVVADLVGCLMVGYSINPIITFGAATIGLCAGFFSKSIKNSRFLLVFSTIFPAHLIGSVLIKTVGLSLYYGMPFLVTIGYRSLTYLIIAAVETLLLYSLSLSKSFNKQMEKYKGNLSKSQRN